MNIAIRLFLGYFLIVGLAGWFVLNIFSQEVEPGVSQATEDTLVDTAHLLAELAAPELAAGRFNATGPWPDATTDRHAALTPFAAAVQAARQRSPGASIYGIAKTAVDFRIYLTDARGRVVFDSEGIAAGADYSRWRDVALVLRGEYGARSTRDDPHNPSSSVMYIAAPVIHAGERIGVLTVSKPSASVAPYVERARDRIHRAGLILLVVSAAIGALFTAWLTWSLNRMRDYAHRLAQGEAARPPTGGGRQLSELARALAHMRDRLDGKQYVERYVQNLAHELKSPLTAVRGAAELLQEAPSPVERERFVGHIREQAERMQLIIERLLALARLEQRQAPAAHDTISLAALLHDVAASRATQAQARGLQLVVRAGPDRSLQGDRFLLQQAVANLVDNAIDFSPPGGRIDLTLDSSATHHRITVCDQGPGAPAYALPHLFERFYSLPRPASGRKSTGLGLAFVREVARLHGGEVSFANATVNAVLPSNPDADADTTGRGHDAPPGSGARVQLTLPR